MRWGRGFCVFAIVGVVLSLAFYSIAQEAPKPDAPTPAAAPEKAAPEPETPAAAPEKTAPAETTDAAPKAAAPATPPEAPKEAPPEAPKEAPSAQEPPTESPAPVADSGAAPNPLAKKDALEIIVIASESMGSELDKGTKVQVIGKALKNALKYVPKGTDIALRVSGHRVSKDNVQQSCDDSELIIAPATGNSAAISTKLAGIQAQGKRALIKPISLALADLQQYGGTKTLLVITDGMDECMQQDPIAFLAPASLRDKGYVIHIRGIGLDRAANDALTNLARGTGGSFASANDAFSLTQQLSIAAQRGAMPPPPPVTAETPTPDAPGPDAPTAPTPPPPGVQPPAPLSFDPNELLQKVVVELKKTVSESLKAADKKVKTPPPPPPKPMMFSKISLSIIAVETLLLVLALAAIVLLLLRQRRE